MTKDQMELLRQAEIARAAFLREQGRRLARAIAALFSGKREPKAA